MIALNMDLPNSCMNCPCLHSILADGMACRFCIVEHREIVIVPEAEMQNDEKWIKFAKPDWCPWVEVVDT